MLEGFRKDFGKENIDEFFEIDEIDFTNNSSDFNFTSYNFTTVINQPPFKYGYENINIDFDEFYTLIMGDNIDKCIPKYDDDLKLIPIQTQKMIIPEVNINDSVSSNALESNESYIIENRRGIYLDSSPNQSILNIINETQIKSYIGHFQNNQLPLLKYSQFQKSNPYESIFRTLTRRIKVIIILFKIFIIISLYH